MWQTGDTKLRKVASIGGDSRNFKKMARSCHMFGDDLCRGFDQEKWKLRDKIKVQGPLYHPHVISLPLHTRECWFFELLLPSDIWLLIFHHISGNRPSHHASHQVRWVYNLERAENALQIAVHGVEMTFCSLARFCHPSLSDLRSALPRKWPMSQYPSMCFSALPPPSTLLSGHGTR